VGKSDGQKSLGRPRCRWVDNVKMDLRDIGLVDMDWTDLDQWKAVVNKVMNIRIS
jgi:hypothetical protein